MKTLSLLLVTELAMVGCSRSQMDTPSSPPEILKKASVLFPDTPSIDDAVYENIQQTCTERWNLEKMKMATFAVRPDRGEFVVECDGTVDGELYHCVIRANSEGGWINDGRTKKNP